MDTTRRSNDTTQSRSGEQSLLISELGDVAHGLRTAAGALTEEHAGMARYAARAAELVEGAAQRLTPAAALLGFVGKRILNGIVAPASKARKSERERIERDEVKQADDVRDVVSSELVSTDGMVDAQTRRGECQPGSLAFRGDTSGTGAQPEINDSELAPAQDEDDRISSDSIQDDRASRSD